MINFSFLKKIGILMLLIYFNVSYSQRIDPLLTTIYNSQTKKIISVRSTTKVGPNLINYFPKSFAKKMGIDLTSSDPLVRVLLRYEGKIENLKKHGINVESKIGNIYTANFQISKLPEIRKIKGITNIVLGKPVNMELDISSVKVRAESARNTFCYDGEGVIVGILDSGIDITHEDFKNPDGTTRILYIWDQIVTTEGQTPADVSGDPDNSWDYGTEWNYTHINDNTCTQKDNTGHGTHVAGIAAGNGRATGNGQPANTYIGMAPKADIIFVRLDYKNYANVTNGLLWIGSKAKELGKPWVGNLSLGTQFGPHDGTSLFEQSIYGITNQTDIGKGRIIVNSAGNEGYVSSDPNRVDTDRLHAFGSNPTYADVEVNSGDGGGRQNEYFWIQIWYPQLTNYSIKMTSPNGRDYGPFAIGEGTGDPGYGWYYTTATDGYVSIHNEHFNDQSNHDNYYSITPDNFIEILLADLDIDSDGTSDYDLRPGTWKITMSNGSGRWDAYIPIASGVSEGVYFAETTYENARIISEPGNAYNVITVGSFNTKNSWYDYYNNYQSRSGYPINDISYFSSPGPTRDNRTKPDIYAPGAWIASSMSKDASISETSQANDRVHFNTTGTSMSAPHVTGAVALLLEQGTKLGKNWSYPDIIGILNESKIPNGYLDIYKALDVNEDSGGIEDRIEITGTQVLNQNSNYTFTSTFIDDEPLGDYIVGNWNWELHAYHADSSIILDSGTSTGPINTTWYCTVPDLNNYESHWSRDENNRVSGYVYCKATDNDNVEHTDKLNIGINAVPDKPIIYQSDGGVGTGKVKLSFTAGGATGYKIYYDTNSGHPYNGSGADQGSSPITLDASTTSLTLTGLTNGTTYYFAVKANNDVGYSEYSTEQYATPITTSGTLTHNEEWPGTGNPGTIEVIGNVTIPGGKTLTILDGTVIKLGSDVRITVESNGHLFANGNFQKIEFTRSSTSESWDRILIYGDNNEFSHCIFDGGYYNVDVRGRYNIFTNCTFKNGVRGINTYKRLQGDWSCFELSNCTFENNSNGGVVALYTYGAINSCTIKNNPGYGLYLYNARIGNNSSYGDKCGLFNENHIHDNGTYGVVLAYNGKLWSGYGSNKGYNKIINNGSHEIYLQNYTNARFYDSNYGGYSSIYDQSGGRYIYNLSKTYNGEYYVATTVVAENNYWGCASGPSSSNFYGPVDYTPYLSSDPTHPTPPVIPHVAGDDSENGGEVLSEGIVNSISSSAAGRGVFSTGGGQGLVDLKNKIQELRNQIDNNADDLSNARRLNEMYSLLTDYDPEDILKEKQPLLEKIAGYRQRLLDNPSGNESVRLIGETAMLLEINNLTEKKEYENAMAMLNDYDKYIKNSDNRRELLSNKLAVFEDKKEYEQALAVLIDLREEVKGDHDHYTPPTYEIIEQNLKSELGIDDGPHAKGNAPENDAFDIAQKLDFALYNNYPNPFNPTTKIPFSLAENSYVKIEVFDILGKRVAILANRIYQKGMYNVEFNGKNLATGLYIIRTEMKSKENKGKKYTFLKKMLLVK